MKKLLSAAMVSAALLPSFANAADLTVTFMNVTKGITLTPVLIASHNSDLALFHVGMEASDELQMMAEGGDISGLSAAVTNGGGTVMENPAMGMLAPGGMFSVDFMTGDETHLSLAAMLLPTNDGFVGLDSWEIPTEAGTYEIYLNGYDAGTEVNDEIVNGGGMPNTPGIPGAPGGAGGMNGTGVMSSETDLVHIHPGNIGDMDATGGVSDVDSRVHRWLNPVAKLVIEVK